MLKEKNMYSIESLTWWTRLFDWKMKSPVVPRRKSDLGTNRGKALKVATHRPRFKLTWLGWACVFVLIWLPLAAMVSMNNYLFIIFGLTVGFVLISHRLAKRNLTSVTVTRRFPVEIFADTPFTMRYLVQSDLPSWGGATLTVEENPPLDGNEHGIGLDRLLPGQPHEESGTFSIKNRGDKTILPGRISSSFPFGLAVYSRACAEGTSVLVFPRIEPIHSEIPFSLTGSGKRVEHANPMGNVPFVLREYVPGDPYKLIDWKKSARTGSFITKILSEDKAQEILIRLPGEPSERALSRAASLVVHFSGLGTPVSIQGPGLMLGPGAGRQFVRKALTTLARWEDRGGSMGNGNHYTGAVVEIDGAGEFIWKGPGEWHG